MANPLSLAKLVYSPHWWELAMANANLIPETALRWYREGRGAVLATVTETWGSAPRPAGSQIAISGKGEITGSVSGGCVEGAVVAEAMETLQVGKARELAFGVEDENAFASGLACGGTIRILVEPVGTVLPSDVLEQLVEARAARRVVAYAVDVGADLRRVVGTDDPRFGEVVAGMSIQDKSGRDGPVFLALNNPPPRLAVVGAVHIAQTLVPMARMAGFDVTVIDPRPIFAGGGRFGGETLCDEWPDEALSRFRPDTRSAVVTLTHDPKLDDPALSVALKSEAFYIGSLGSRRTHAKRLERLAAAGIPAGRLARIHAPVGLDIGANSPAEIAVAIMAEIVAALRGRSKEEAIRGTEKTAG